MEDLTSDFKLEYIKAMRSLDAKVVTVDDHCEMQDDQIQKEFKLRNFGNFCPDDELTISMQAKLKEPSKIVLIPSDECDLPDNMIEGLSIRFENMADAYVPARSFPGDAGLDLLALNTCSLIPNAVMALDMGFSIVEIPQGYYFEIREKSSLAMQGIHILGGIIDNEYRGKVIITIQNLGWIEHKIVRGDKIAQLITRRLDVVPITAVVIGKTEMENVSMNEVRLSELTRASGSKKFHRNDTSFGNSSKRNAHSWDPPHKMLFARKDELINLNLTKKNDKYYDREGFFAVRVERQDQHGNKIFVVHPEWDRIFPRLIPNNETTPEIRKECFQKFNAHIRAKNDSLVYAVESKIVKKQKLNGGEIVSIDGNTHTFGRDALATKSVLTRQLALEQSEENTKKIEAQMIKLIKQEEKDWKEYLQKEADEEFHVAIADPEFKKVELLDQDSGNEEEEEEKEEDVQTVSIPIVRLERSFPLKEKFDKKVEEDGAKLQKEAGKAIATVIKKKLDLKEEELPYCAGSGWDPIDDKKKEPDLKCQEEKFEGELPGCSCCFCEVKENDYAIDIPKELSAPIPGDQPTQ